MPQLFIANEENNLVDQITFGQYSNIILVADARTNGFCIPVLKKTIPLLATAKLIIIPAGEENKTLDNCNYLWSQFIISNVNKHSLIIAVGGGSLLDQVGFCSSLFKRGIKVAYIPTTLLAMVDAAHGGKTGIDFEGIKNLLGIIEQPGIIYINPIFLHTLPTRVLKSGIAEMIKHALISGQEYWEKIKNYTVENFCSMEAIQSSMQLKYQFVKQDFKDQHIRQALNFGHSIGHALESYMLKSNHPLLHGEAIILGMELELSLSTQLHHLPYSVLAEYKELKNRLFKDLDIKLNTENLIPYLQHDKKNDSHYRMSLLQSIGNPIIQSIVTSADIHAVNQ